MDSYIYIKLHSCLVIYRRLNFQNQDFLHLSSNCPKTNISKPRLAGSLRNHPGAQKQSAAWGHSIAECGKMLSWMDDISPIMKEYTRAQVCQIILSVGRLGLATNNFVTGFRVRVLPWWVAPDSYPWPLLLLRTLPNPVVQPPTRLLRLSKVDH